MGSGPLSDIGPGSMSALLWLVSDAANLFHWRSKVKLTLDNELGNSGRQMIGSAFLIGNRI